VGAGAEAGAGAGAGAGARPVRGPVRVPVLLICYSPGRGRRKTDQRKNGFGSELF
jgi:hypothetical protein